MSDVKVSQLQLATTTVNSDLFMVVQGNANKRMTLATLCANLNSSVTVNSKLESIDFTIHGESPNLLCTDAVTNTVGVRTEKAVNSAFQVVGDIRVGGTVSKDASISAIVVGVSDSGGAGKKLVTVTTLANHGFAASDQVVMDGINPADLEGLFEIAVPGLNTFTYTIANAISIGTIILSSATATRTIYYPGLYKGSLETVLVEIAFIGDTHVVDGSYSYTGLDIAGTTSFELAAGSEGQEKVIYLKAAATASTATFNLVVGAGFNRIKFRTVGDSVKLMWDGSSWVCLGLYGAELSTYIP